MCVLYCKNWQLVLPRLMVDFKRQMLRSFSTVPQRGQLGSVQTEEQVAKVLLQNYQLLIHTRRTLKGFSFFLLKICRFRGQAFVILYAFKILWVVNNDSSR